MFLHLRTRLPEVFQSTQHVILQGIKHLQVQYKLIIAEDYLRIFHCQDNIIIYMVSGALTPNKVKPLPRTLATHSIIYILACSRLRSPVFNTWCLL